MTSNTIEAAKQSIAQLQQVVGILTGAIKDSGMDLAPCLVCGKPIICLPDGLALCRACVATAEDPERIPAI